MTTMKKNNKENQFEDMMNIFKEKYVCQNKLEITRQPKLL